MRGVRNIALVAVGPRAGTEIRKLRAWGGDLRIVWSYQADRELRPNSVSVNIYNLSAESRAILDAFDAEGAELLMVLQAGTEAGGLRDIAVADIVDVEHTRKGADWITTIEAGEGERTYTDAHVSVSLLPGATVEQILDSVTEVYAAGGITLDRSRLNQLPQVQRLRGFSYEGRASDAIPALAEELGIKATTQLGKLVLSSNDPAPAVRSVLLSADTGLIGTPKRTSTKRDGLRWEIEVLFRLAIQVGDVVAVKSVAWTGTGIVDEIEAAGDTHGAATATLTVIPLTTESE